MSFSLMKQYTDARGGSEREAKRLDSRRAAADALLKDISYNDSVFVWEPGKDRAEMKKIPVCLYDEKMYMSRGVTVSFGCPAGEAPKVGEVLYDSTKNKYWLCTQSFDRDGVITAGELTQCQIMLKWQDKDGSICEYPAADINATQYNAGVSGNDMILLGSAKHILSLPADERTAGLCRGKRFFLGRADPAVFKITQNDSTSLAFGKGIIRITVTEDEYDPSRDNIKIRVCDFVQ